MGAALGALLARHHGRHANGAGLGQLIERQALLHRVLLAARQNALDGVGHRRHFRVMPQGHARAVGLFVAAQAHGATVPGHFAHIRQCALQKAATRSQRQQPHTGRDPLLRLIVLPHRHEKLDGAIHRALAHARRHGQERDDEVQALLPLLRPVLDFLCHRVQPAFGTAFNHHLHWIDGRHLSGGHGGCCLRHHGSGHRRRRCRCSGCGLQHSTQNGVGAVGGQALEARLPGLQVEVFKVSVGIVSRNVDGLGN